MYAKRSPAEPRGRFQGVAQVWRYNRHWYAAALGVCALAALALAWARPSGIAGAALWTATALTLWFSLASLGASYYVYDRSRLWRWSWLDGLLPRTPRRWLLVHAGLDESSEALRRLFPPQDARILDIYDPRAMTESSLHAARAELHSAGAGARFDALDLPAADRDTAFLVLAAHELRSRQDRSALFGELARVLVPQGRVLLVEHLRDGANIAVYGPGAWHFHSRREWLESAAQGGLALVAERRINLFVRAFVFAAGSL